MADAWELMAEAERVAPAVACCRGRVRKGREGRQAQAELDALLDKKEQLKAAYFHRAKAAVALGSKEK